MPSLKNKREREREREERFSSGFYLHVLPISISDDQEFCTTLGTGYEQPWAQTIQKAFLVRYIFVFSKHSFTLFPTSVGGVIERHLEFKRDFGTATESGMVCFMNPDAVFQKARTSDKYNSKERIGAPRPLEISQLAHRDQNGCKCLWNFFFFL